MRTGRLSVHVGFIGATNGGALTDEVHHLSGGFDADFLETAPYDGPIFFLPNLNLSPHRWVFRCQQINEIFVVNLDEGSLDGAVPRVPPFLFELLDRVENSGHCSGNNAHAVIGIRWVRIQVHSGHGVSLARGCLAIGEDGAIESLQKAGDQWRGGGGENGVLRRSLRMDLVKSKRLLLGERVGSR